MILSLGIACLMGCSSLTSAGKPVSAIGTPLQITTVNLPSGTVNSNYNVNLTAAGGFPPYTWNAIGGQLPKGLTLSSTTGAITGTPITVGPFSFTAQVHDADSDADSQSVALDIAPANSSLQLTTISLPVGTINSNYSAALTATGGAPPYSWSKTLGQLPLGITLGAATGAITGTPSQAGTFSFTTSVSDSKAANVSSLLSLNISTAPAPTITAVSPNTGATAGGTSVTITGMNFQPGATVKFGTTPATSAQITNSTQIQATTPAEATGSITVSVINADGQVATDASAFTFVSVHAQGCPGIPITYCGKTDTTSYRGAAPALGASGTVTTDPDFGGKVLRMTQNGFCGETAGQRYVPDSGSGTQRSFNADDSKLLIANSYSGGYYYINTGLPGSMAGAAGAPTCLPLPGGRNPNFAWTATNLIYYSDTDNKHMDSWDTVSGHAGVKIHDMSTIPDCTMVFMYLLEGDDNDAWFFSATNSQNLGTQICGWNQSTGNTQVINIAAATEQQNSGTPVALDNLTATQLAGCGVHGFVWNRSATWLDIVLDGCTDSVFAPSSGAQEIYWEVGTNHVTYAGVTPIDYRSAHAVLGFDNGSNGPAYVNNPGGGNQPPCPIWNSRGWALWFLNNLGGVGVPTGSNYVEMNPCLGTMSFVDQHISWQNNKNDANVNKYPIIVQADQDRNTTNTGDYMEWEIDALQPGPALTLWNASSFGKNANGTIWRLVHTYNDAVMAQCPEMAYTSAVVSRDGKYVAFASDWLGAAGSSAGTASPCTNNRRLDTFILDATTSGVQP